MNPPTRMFHFIDAANLMTLTSLLAAVTCALLAIEQHIAWAVVALILSGLCDLFDGLVARRMSRSDAQRAFGGQLDSLVDAAAFGFAPVVLLFASGCRSPYELFLLAFLPLCVVWRVAYFHAVPMSEIEGKKYFFGLPCTYVALFLPLVYLVALWQASWLRPGLAAMTVFLLLAMTTTRKVRKPSGLAYVFFLVIAVIAIGLLLVKGGDAFASATGR